MRLRGRRDDASRVADGVNAVKFGGMVIEDNTATISMVEDMSDEAALGIIKNVAVAMEKILDTHEATNYVEMEAAVGRWPQHRREVILTVQRGGHPTPHALRQQAEAERDEALERLADVEAQLAALRTQETPVE